MDAGVNSNHLFSPRKKSTIPFAYNQIYDPFIKNFTSKIHKSSFESGTKSSLELIILDTVRSAINVALRKKKEKWVQAIPVIIYNNSSIDTNFLYLQRGSAILIQEIKNMDNEWIEIENITKEKIGKFYYKIAPKQYVYTKIPIYKGNLLCEMRIKLITSDSTNIISNEFKGKIKKWMIN